MNMYKDKKLPIYSYSFLLIITIMAACKKESPFQYRSKPEIIINGSDKRLNNSEVHFVKDTVYVFATDITIADGHTLLIDAGTLIKANNITITIEQGGKIEAIGSAEQPIVFTANSLKGHAGITGFEGTWKGIQIFGNASGESSGTLSYVRIEFAGNSPFSASSAMLFTNVSNKTILNNIQVSYSFAKPSFTFTGGNCNASNLVSYAAAGADFILQKGYRGMLQNLLAYRHPNYAEGEPDGMYIRDTSTSPVISNLTMLGPDLKYGINPAYIAGLPSKRAGLITEGGCKFHIRNSLLYGYPAKSFIGLSPTPYYGYGYFIDGTNTALSLNNGESELSYSIIYHADTSAAFYLPPNVYPPYTSTDLKDFLLQPKFNNSLVTDSSKFMFTDPYNYFSGLPNPLPLPGSFLLTGADFNDPNYTDPFFNKVNYRGALGADNWMQGWVNFIPLQIDYNN